MALHPGGGYYVLTADGTVHAFDGAPSFGSDQLFGYARAMAVMPDGQGYSVLDGLGGVHHFGSATALKPFPTPYWPGKDIARDIAITPTGGGFVVLDGYGGTHRGDDAPAGPVVAQLGHRPERGRQRLERRRVPARRLRRGHHLGRRPQGLERLLAGPGRGPQRGRRQQRRLRRARRLGHPPRRGHRPRRRRSTPGQGWRAVDVDGGDAVAVRADGFSQHL